MRHKVIGAALVALGVLLMLSQGHEAQSGTWEASCYGAESGPVTASGEEFVPSGHTAASRTLPFGTRLLVRHGTRSVTVTVNDRGPYIEGRDLDLAMGACQAIGLVESGTGPVEVEQIESSSASGSEKLPETGGAWAGPK